MRTRLMMLGVAGVLAGAMALTAAGLAAADGPGFGRHGGMHPATMMGTRPTTQMTAVHDQMQAALAAALQMTVDDLRAELSSGKTIPQIARERGVDLADVWAAMQAAHAAAGMPGAAMHGMGGFGMGGGRPDRMGPPARDGAGPCPWAGS